MIQFVWVQIIGTWVNLERFKPTVRTRALYEKCVTEKQPLKAIPAGGCSRTVCNGMQNGFKQSSDSVLFLFIYVLTIRSTSNSKLSPVRSLFKARFSKLFEYFKNALPNSEYYVESCKENLTNCNTPVNRSN